MDEVVEEMLSTGGAGAFGRRTDTNSGTETGGRTQEQWQDFRTLWQSGSLYMRADQRADSQFNTGRHP
jgi:hypothetical protein